MSRAAFTLVVALTVLAACGAEETSGVGSSPEPDAASATFPVSDTAAQDAPDPGEDSATSTTPDVKDAGFCYPECFAKACGDDGCGGSCGACPAGTVCEAGLCEGEPDCVPACEGLACGADGCGGACGSCGEGATCEGGQCVPVQTCTPDCAGKVCGPDGCGGSCGGCGAPSSCVGGQCVCEPDCTGKACGDDGCGGSCGGCVSPDVCTGGACVCAPDCEDNPCGDDGCGGSCGPCGCAQHKVFIRGATLGEPSDLQVFFITEESPTWDEMKSKWASFDTGGAYETIEVAVGTKANYSGTITGLRIDPQNSDEPFGIDDVCVGYTPDDCLLHWSFDGASEVTSPFFDWTLVGIGELWTDGERWGGQGIAGDPRFRVFFELPCAP